jgi:hypothetical protein
VLNLVLAWVGTAAYHEHVASILENSLYSSRLVHGFNAMTLIELFTRPESGPFVASAMPAYLSAFLFAIATLLLMPGVLRQYTSEYRVSRDEFFRNCGRNLWRYVRLALIYAVIAIPATLFLSWLRDFLREQAEKATNEVLPFWVGVGMLVVMFVAMTTVRVWFDLAQVDVVVRDQNAVRKSVGSGFRYTRRYWGRLVGAYVGIGLLALIILGAGIWLWHGLVAPSTVFGAFVIGQIMMVLWLAMRFWQRAVAAVFYMREMLVSPSFSGFQVREPGPTAGPNSAPLPSPS